MKTKAMIILMALAMTTPSAKASQKAACDFTTVQQVNNVKAMDADFNWISVEMETPGSLGVEVMYQVNALSDVEYLKIRGTLNDADWTTLKNMANLKGVDFTNAKFEAIPNEQFRDRSTFHLVYMPEGMKSIGDRAFYRTGLTSITIPSTVTTIGNYAFQESKALEEVLFASNSILTTIKEYAFYNCSALLAFSMPNTVSSLGNSAFNNCTSLSSVTLSSALTEIPYLCFFQTSTLKNIEFPQGLKSIGYEAFENSGLENVVLPIGLVYLGYEAFRNCHNLKTAELPATPNPYYYNNNKGYQSTFSYCTSLEKIICHAATPPAINSDPFDGVDRSKVTLVVPAFAIVDYKLDTYWHEFGTIQEGAEPTYLDIAGTLSLTNNRRPNNKVDILLDEDGKLIVGGSAPMEVGSLTFTVNRPNKAYGQLLNNCPNMSVEDVSTKYYVNSNRWYFLAPLHDINVNDVSHSNTEASFIFRYYNGQNRATNGASGSWQDLNNNTLKAGQGYIFQTNREGWITMPAVASGKNAAIEADDASVELKAYTSANAADAGWNFVGNPYPCFYDVYYMDFNAPITVWNYDNRTYQAFSIVDDNYVLSPMEGFFVQKTDDKGQILFQKEGRQTSAAVERVASARLADDSRRLFDIQVSDGNSSDRTRVVINQHASLGYEATCDAVKFFSSEADVPQLYTLDEDDNQLAINERPLTDGIIKMGFKASTTGTYTLHLNRNAGDIVLTDLQTGKTIDLAQEDYEFSVDDISNNDSRFLLTISSSPTGMEELAIPTSDKNTFDLQGRKIVNSQLKSGVYIQNGKKHVVK